MKIKMNLGTAKKYLLQDMWVAPEVLGDENLD
jgi:hypothetical protein